MKRLSKVEREAKKFTEPVARHNARLHAEHAKYIAEILALRPGWDSAKLQAIGKSYGLPGTEPGLYDILTAVKRVAAFDAAYGLEVQVTP